MCDVIVYSHGEGMRKPDPRFYELACARLGVAPDRVLFVDDTEGHVDAARRLGMTGILFVDTEQAIEDIRAVGAV
jgi:putative hydrolase of the HAD superfamily